MGSRPGRIRLGGQGIGQHVIGLSGVLDKREQLGIGAVLSEPMLELDKGGDTRARQRTPATLPTLNRVAVNADLFSESFLAESGRLPEQLQQVASDDPIPGAGDRTTATSTSGG